MALRPGEGLSVLALAALHLALPGAPWASSAARRAALRVPGEASQPPMNVHTSDQPDMVKTCRLHSMVPSLLYSVGLYAAGGLVSISSIF